MIRLGVDFGGTKIEAAVLDEKGRFLARLRRPNPRAYEAALRTLRDLVAEAEQAAGRDRAACAGVAMPGSISPKTGLVRNANSTWLNGRPFQADLERMLERPVRVANDANCLALSEAVDGAGAGADLVYAVIIGTGCGAGLAVNGRPVAGRNGIAGEFGHAPLPWPRADDPDEAPAPACWCGQAGCLELYVSGTGFEADYRRRCGVSVGAPDIVERAKAGETAAGASLQRYIDRLGRGLAMVCNLLDPDVIVLGGGMSNVEALYPVLPAA
ncbi:MAG: ROK family protein, partial [Caulobacteraceae bacterium]|nr:ROK family protein [Caulobacteraceae bacterium]